jgi:hypothetical protein
MTVSFWEYTALARLWMIFVSNDSDIRVGRNNLKRSTYDSLALTSAENDALGSYRGEVSLGKLSQILRQGAGLKDSLVPPLIYRREGDDAFSYSAIHVPR